MTRPAYRRDHAPRHIEYVTVKATMANWTDAAILITSEKLTTPAWVPRTALEPTCRAVAWRTLRGGNVELQIEIKMAESKGLI